MNAIDKEKYFINDVPVCKKYIKTWYKIHKRALVICSTVVDMANNIIRYKTEENITSEEIESENETYMNRYDKAKKDKGVWQRYY